MVTLPATTMDVAEAVYTAPPKEIGALSVPSGKVFLA